VPTGLAVGNVGGKHEDGDGGDGEPQNDDEFGEVGLVKVIGVLVIDEEIYVDEEYDNAYHDRHDHQRQVEVPHSR